LISSRHLYASMLFDLSLNECLLLRNKPSVVFLRDSKPFVSEEQTNCL
jgi:hypothetical protein